jgi:dTDP-glucose pyrophosphorylase
LDSYLIMIMDNLLILYTASVLTALRRLENNSSISTLLVIDENKRLLGTLTDGDIRRYLINGGQLEQSILDVAHKNYRYIRENEGNLFSELKVYKESGIKIIPIIDCNNQIVDVLDLIHFRSKLPIDAVLMAGGKGERLRPLTEKTPKPLVKVGDKCIIDYNIDRLIDFGVKHLNVTVNYLAEQIESHFAEPRKGVRVYTYREPKFLGTIGSIRFIDRFYNDTVLVMNSDLFTNIDYEDFYLHFQNHDAEMSVAAVPYNVSIPYGVLDLDGRNIKGLLEKPKYVYYANAGIYLIKKRVLSEIPENIFFNATDLIEKLIFQNKKVIRYPLNGTWIDIGQYADLQKAQNLANHLK